MRRGLCAAQTVDARELEQLTRDDAGPEQRRGTEQRLGRLAEAEPPFAVFVAA